MASCANLQNVSIRNTTRAHYRGNRPDFSVPDALIRDTDTIFIPTNDKIAMVPSRIVPNILLEQVLDGLELASVPEREPLHQPLPVAPDVVVFAVVLEHLRNEIRLAVGRTQPVDDELAVVPDLVVFLVREGRLVEPGYFLGEVCVYGFENLCAV